MNWLERAANQGYAPAEYELGRIYLYGHGVDMDYAKALVWEQKAAEQGDPRAQRDLALMYERGFGVTADPAQAADWNRKAAAQGHPEAQAHLAQALADGPGSKKIQQRRDVGMRRQPPGESGGATAIGTHVRRQCRLRASHPLVSGSSRGRRNKSHV